MTQENLELLLGQRAVVDLTMSLSSVQETVTVTGEAPLVDVSRTRMGGNIEPRQMQKLPILGRNWMDLSMLALLAPGSKANHVDESPAQGGADNKSFQLNMDGQQVTNMVSSAGFGQPRFSRDLIAEFERQTGPGTAGRLGPDGTIMPRNAVVGRPLHRVDLRIQRQFPIPGDVKIDGIFEVFNLFNHANFGSYVTVETNRLYGQPTQNTNVAYQPRMLQLGFRLVF